MTVRLGEDIGFGSPSRLSMGKVLVVVLVIVAGLGIVFGIAFINLGPSPLPPQSSSTIYTTPTVPEPPHHGGGAYHHRQATNTNHPPLANNQYIVTSMNKAITITLTANDPDLNDNLTAILVSKPSHGTLGNIDQNTGNITYTPNPGFTGIDKFTYKVNDGKANSNNVGTISITVNGAP